MIKKDRAKTTILILVDNKIEFSKKCIKYLIKKFHKREDIVIIFLLIYLLLILIL